MTHMHFHGKKKSAHVKKYALETLQKNAIATQKKSHDTVKATAPKKGYGTKQSQGKKCNALWGIEKQNSRKDSHVFLEQHG